MEFERGDFALAISRYCRIRLPRAFTGAEAQQLHDYFLRGPELKDRLDGWARQGCTLLMVSLRTAPADLDRSRIPPPPCAVKPSRITDRDRQRRAASHSWLALRTSLRGDSTVPCGFRATVRRG